MRILDTELYWMLNWKNNISKGDPHVVFTGTRDVKKENGDY